MKIPKILHRVWIGSVQKPDEYDMFWHGWQNLHPDWTFMDWHDGNVSELELYPLIQQTRSPASGADIARYEIIFKFGGVYIDCDFECKKNLENLLDDADFVVCNQVNDFSNVDYCSNGFFAAIPQHSILKEAVHQLKAISPEVINSKSPEHVSGPYFFRAILGKFLEKVKILNTEHFYPYLFSEKERFLYDANSIYAVHHWGGSWLSDDQLLGLAHIKLAKGDISGVRQVCSKVRDQSDNKFFTMVNSMNKKMKQKSKIYSVYQSVFRKELLSWSIELSTERAFPRQDKISLTSI
jgi:mannosyltransferase OCH1-like enzyme